jgi:hypothetical protein
MSDNPATQGQNDANLGRAMTSTVGWDSSSANAYENAYREQQKRNSGS